MDGERERSSNRSKGLIQLAARVAISLGALIQLVFEQKLGLHTFFGQRETGHDVALPPLGARNRLAIKGILFLRQITGRPGLLEGRLRRAYDRMAESLETAGWPKGGRLEIATYRAGEITPREFYRNHVKTGKPALIRGMGHYEAERWSLDFFAEKFPELHTQVLDLSSGQVFTEPLPGLLPAIKDGKVKPFQAALDPEQARYFDLGRFADFFGTTGRLLGSVATYLIIGRKRGVNAPMHCEAGLNWYFELSGTRHWTLIDAEYSWLLYPSSEGTGMRRFSEYIPDPEGNPMDAEKYSLVDYAPRYELDLHPGDILYHPAWMWHKTLGLEDHCVGIRFNFVAPTPMPHRFFRFLQLISPEFWTLSAEYLSAILGNADQAEREKSSTTYNDCEVALWQQTAAEWERSAAADEERPG
ncbi:MAG: cupin-like domain-containing protein [Deltaproteobacteria bacterium]|nr:cupin-like domain-containing protein [Deltaproteobacteria bacterium]